MKCFRPGSVGLGPSQFSGRCPCLWEQGGTGWALKPLPTQPQIQGFHDLAVSILLLVPGENSKGLCKHRGDEPTPPRQRGRRANAASQISEIAVTADLSKAPRKVLGARPCSHSSLRSPGIPPAPASMGRTHKLTAAPWLLEQECFT